MQTIHSIALDDAQRVIAAGIAQAKKNDQPSVIAVADAGGRLVALARMDGAWQGSLAIAIDKAFTARAFDLSTQELGTMAQPGKPFYGIANSNDGHVMIFAGGMPLKADGDIVGAVGVSGGTGEQDQSAAEAAAAAL